MPRYPVGEMIDFHVAESRCIKCSEPITAATPLTGDVGPKPNDVAVCAHCGQVQAYDYDLTFRELTLPEAFECSNDPDVRIAQAMAVAFQKIRP